MAGRRTLRVVGEVLLTAAAVLGTLAILAVAAFFYLNMSFVLFKSGSMYPAIPTGSLALVREIPAGGIQVGDVVTVDRDGRRPVTHRVTSIAPGADGAALITMRGDANTADDPQPYLVTTVRKVIWSAPGLAYPIVWLSQPLVLGVITLGATGLVGWALWPRQSAGERRPEDAESVAAELVPQPGGAD